MNKIQAIIHQVAGDFRGIIFKRQHPPQNLTWFITERCNLNCRHCFVVNKSRKIRQEMSWRDQLIFAREAKLEQVTITGGEPTLCAQLPELVSILDAKKGMRGISLATNGFRSNVVLELLAKRNRALRYHVQTSLDGPRDIHNTIRGSAQAFALVESLLKGIHKADGVSTHAIMTLSAFNLPYLKETIKIANDLGTFLSLNFIRASSQTQAKNKNDFIPDNTNDLTIDAIKSAVQLWEETPQPPLSSTTRWLEMVRLKNVIYFLETGCWPFPCAAGINDAILYPDGSVAICETLLPIGNLRDHRLNWDEFWKNNPQQLKTCYCQWDCAMQYSLSKSFAGYRTLFASKTR